MKLLKLSLATAVVAGALTSLSAAPLEEAIKDIDVSGFGRYRYQADYSKKADQFVTVQAPNGKIVTSSLGETKSNDNFHRFTLDVNFKATLDDNFFAVIGVRYDSRDVSGSGNATTHKFRGITNNRGGLAGINATYGNGWGGAGDSFAIRQYYVGFTGLPNTTILAGRQPIGAFFTDDSVGTGLKIVNSSIEGLTLAAVAFDNIEDDGDLANLSSLSSANVAGVMPGLDSMPYQNNLYGVAVIGDYDFVNFQLWYAHLQNVTNVWAIDLGGKYAINDDVSIRARVNVAGTSFTGKFKDRLTPYAVGSESAVGSSTFVGATAGLTAYGFGLDAGYIQFGKKDKTSLHTVEDDGHFIKAGEELLTYNLFSGKHKVWFVKAGYTYDAFSVGVDYVHDKVKNEVNPDMKNTEWVLRAGYKYNDKLSFTAWYSMITEKTLEKSWTDLTGMYTDESYKNKRNRFRFDARYNF